MHGQHHNLNLWPDLFHFLEKRHTGKSRHLKIRKKEVYLFSFQKFQRLLGVSGIANHFHPVFFPVYQSDDTSAHQLLVIYHKYSYHFRETSPIFMLLSPKTTSTGSKGIQISTTFMPSSVRSAFSSKLSPKRFSSIRATY